MKKNLRLFFATAFCMFGMGQGFAQSVPDPLVNLQFGKDTVFNAGTYQGSPSGYGEDPYATGAFRAKKTERMPGMMSAVSLYDAANNKYVGSCSWDPASLWYLRYNKVNDALGQAFLHSYTIEFLYRLDRPDSRLFRNYWTVTQGGKKVYADKFNYFYQYDKEIMASWNGWGWRFYDIENNENAGLQFQVYGTNKNDYSVTAADGTTTDHTPGYDQTPFVCASSVKQIPGKFYHVVATVDWDTNKVVDLYINGKKESETAISDTIVSKLPALGLGPGTAGNIGAWMNVGAGTAGYVPYSSPITADVGRAPYSISSVFVSAKVYDGALSEEQVKSLYTDDVKKYTEQGGDIDKDMLMDVQFAKDGSAKDASGFKADIVKVGEGATVAYDDAQKRNVATFTDEDFEINGTAADAKYTQNFYYRDFAMDHKFISNLNDAFSIELYTKLSNATPTHAMVPLGVLNYDTGGDYSTTRTDYWHNRSENGVGCMVSSTGRIGFELNTSGAYHKDDGTTAWKERALYSALGANDYVGEYCTDAAVASTDWQHIVMTFDRTGGNGVSLYVNGEPKAEGSMDSLEYLCLTSAAYQYFAIGADANYSTTKDYGEWAFDGNMSICRIWKKALSYDDIQSLFAEAKTPGTTVTLDKNGYGTLCVPYNFTVPAGLTAFVVSAQDGSTVELTKFLGQGGVVAYGTPVILKGKANATFTIAAAPGDNAVTPKVNLLYGTFVSKDVPAKFVYEVNSTDQEMDMNAEAKTLAAHTAYLPVGTSTADYKAFGSIVTAIDVLDVKPETKVDNVYYDLSGRRINKPSKGLYLQKGKKVLVK
jgi:hypothetical protein